MSGQSELERPHDDSPELRRMSDLARRKNIEFRLLGILRHGGYPRRHHFMFVRNAQLFQDHARPIQYRVAHGRKRFVTPQTTMSTQRHRATKGSCPTATVYAKRQSVQHAKTRRTWIAQHGTINTNPPSASPLAPITDQSYSFECNEVDSTRSIDNLGAR